MGIFLIRKGIAEYNLYMMAFIKSSGFKVSPHFRYQLPHLTSQPFVVSVQIPSTKSVVMLRLLIQGLISSFHGHESPATKFVATTVASPPSTLH